MTIFLISLKLNMKWHSVLILAVYLCTLTCDYSESCFYCGSKSFQIVLPPGASVISQTEAASTCTSSQPSQNVPNCNKCQNCQRSCCTCRQQPSPTTLSVPFYKCVPTTTNIVIQVQGSNNSEPSDTTTDTTSTSDNNTTSPDLTTDPATTDGTTSDTATGVTPNETSNTNEETEPDTPTCDPVFETDTTSTDPATETDTTTTDPAAGTDTTTTDPNASSDNPPSKPTKNRGRRVNSKRKRPTSSTGSTATANSNSSSSTNQQESNTDDTPDEDNGDTTENKRRRRSTPETSQKTTASAEASPDGSQAEKSNNATPIKQTKNYDTNSECTSQPQITTTKYSDGSYDIDIVQQTEKPTDIGNDLRATVDYICIQTITIKNGTVNATSIDQNEIYILEVQRDELITIGNNDTDTTTYKWKIRIDDCYTAIIDRKYTLYTDYSDNWIYGKASSELEVNLYGPDESVASTIITSDTESEVDTTDLEFEDDDC